MKSLNKLIDRFCYKHPRFGIPNLMLYMIIGNALVYILDEFSSYTFSSIISFYLPAIARGEIWRLITFIFVPESHSNFLFFALTLYFYYFIGSALEREWGSGKFTVFYLLGVC